jgi:bacteriocin-like protein
MSEVKKSQREQLNDEELMNVDGGGANPARYIQEEK